MKGREEIRVLGFGDDFMMTPDYFYFDLVGAVLMFEKHVGLRLVVITGIEQFADPAEFLL
jgi:hypothetical protein